MKRLMLSLLITLFSIHAFSMGEVQGKVMKQDSSAVAGATVKLERNNTIIASTMSDENGFYTIKAEPGTYLLSATYVGYEEALYVDLVVSNDKITFQDITMADEGITLPPIDIFRPLVDVGNPGFSVEVPPIMIKKGPALDLREVLGNQTGVYSKDDGGPNQFMGQRINTELVVWDGIPYKGMIHIPMDAIETIQIHFSGISARYGDFTSAVVEITTVTY